ncbi:MAG: hypothetical protein J6K85_03885 [Clostridia bacterium]|nr:hypothetical protein [Clostridia bacterium]
MIKHKNTFNALFILAIFVAVLHLVFLGISTPQVDVGSMVMNLIPYGLPILVFASARGASVKDKPTWSRSGFLSMALFSLSFLAMSVHVTYAFFNSSQPFINAYFNLPIIYSAPMLLFAILWLGLKRRVTVKGHGVFGKFIVASPAIILVAMVIHVVIASVNEIIEQSDGLPMTSAPWWVTSLIISLAYIAALTIALLIRAIYNRVRKK